MINFRTYQLSLDFYRAIAPAAEKMPYHLKDQLLRAASSISLNLAEGWGKQSCKDRKRFFQIAFGSMRESQCILELHPLDQRIHKVADILAASIYKLIRNAP